MPDVPPPTPEDLAVALAVHYGILTTIPDANDSDSFRSYLHAAAIRRAVHAETRLAAALAMLKRCEWDNGYNRCPSCTNEESAGHAPGCELAKLLEGT